MGDRDWLRLKDALEYCRANGKTLTGQGLRGAGDKHGFSRKDVQGRWWFSCAGINEYLAESLADPGVDWESVPVIAKRLDVSAPSIYVWIRKGLITSKRLGGHKAWRHYVRESDIKKLADRVHQKRNHGRESD